jgi:ubiquinone/menaquinone biosynthesis C-methylase UbiE
MKSTLLRAVEAVPPLRRRILASSDYALLPVGATGIEHNSASGWDDGHTARRQDRAWRKLTEDAVHGRPRADIRALLDAVGDYAVDASALLEVGCGSGYFSRILGSHFPDVRYVGLDYSERMIRLARERYPRVTFVRGDATRLDFSDNAFDLLIDGAALIHIPEWQRALGEYSRVSHGPVILNSLTLTDSGPTRTLTKRAYGRPVVELVFSRSHLLEVIASLGRRVTREVVTLDYDLERHVSIKTTSELWVCE